MSAQLTVRYEFNSDPEDDFGWLEIFVETDPFVGRGGFWVQWQNIEEWASKVGVFPLSAESPSNGEWGQCNGDGSNYEVIIGVSIFPVNRTGDLDVIVRIADHHDTRRQCQAVFRTNYPDTERFADHLQAMMRRERFDAVLLGRNVC